MREYKFPKVRGLEYKELEQHVAESKWQYCNCQTCQEKRFKLDSMPGKKIDYGTFRLTWRELLMIDVFVKIYASNLIRLGMAMVTVERLMVDAERGEIRLHLLAAEGSMASPNWVAEKQFPLDRFHIDAKCYAEAHAQSEIYVVFDDDQLIIGRDWLARGLEVFGRHPEVGMAAAHMITGEVPAPAGEEPFWECNSIGCPYFIRKGILTGPNNLHPDGQTMLGGMELITIPEGTLSNFDTLLTEQVNQLRWKTGFLRHVRYNHLGSGYSLVGVALGNPTAWQG